jgi:hypothetical protein
LKQLFYFFFSGLSVDAFGPNSIKNRPYFVFFVFCWKSGDGWGRLWTRPWASIGVYGRVQERPRTSMGVHGRPWMPGITFEYTARVCEFLRPCSLPKNANVMVECGSALISPKIHFFRHSKKNRHFFFATYYQCKWFRKTCCVWPF